MSHPELSLSEVIRRHEITEAGHRIMNPFSVAKLALLGEICTGGGGERLLDLACGKGELLCSWARAHGITGVGVDLSQRFLADARARAAELGVSERVRFEHGDAATFDPGPVPFDIVSCIGATWIGGGLLGTLELMRRRVVPDGLLLVGEPFWRQHPADGDLLGGPDDFADLVGTVRRCESTGDEVVEMVLADPSDWDRLEASQWFTAERWARNHPDRSEVEALRSDQRRWRDAYLSYGRERWGWGVFVVRVAAGGAAAPDRG